MLTKTQNEELVEQYVTDRPNERTTQPARQLPGDDASLAIMCVLSLVAVIGYIISKDILPFWIWLPLPLLGLATNMNGPLPISWLAPAMVGNLPVGPIRTARASDGASAALLSSFAKEYLQPKSLSNLCESSPLTPCLAMHRDTAGPPRAVAFCGRV